MTGAANQRQSLRRSLREQRRNLAAPRRRDAEQRVARTILSHPWFARARHVAFYMAFDGEVDLTAVTTATRSHNKRFYLPQIGTERSRTLRFAPVNDGASFCQNRFGIDEPANGYEIDPRHLDLVLTPLVGFDANGTRLGMGGGHYDRTFAFLNSRRLWRHPKLLGVGFESQRVEHLRREAWDVPLHGAVTEAVTLSFSTGDQ